jgi:hypothetical protein
LTKRNPNPGRTQLHGGRRFWDGNSGESKTGIYVFSCGLSLFDANPDYIVLKIVRFSG